MDQAKIVAVLTSIGESVKEIKSLLDGDSRTELVRTIEGVKEVAQAILASNFAEESQLQGLKLSRNDQQKLMELMKALTQKLDPDLLKLQEAAQEALVLGNGLEDWLTSSENKLQEFHQNVAQIKNGTTTVPTGVIRNLCELLLDFEQMGESFSTALEALNGQLDRAQRLASELQRKLDDTSKEMSRTLGKKMWQQVATAAGFFVTAAGCVTLGFFTEGATWGIVPVLIVEVRTTFKKARKHWKAKRASTKNFNAKSASAANLAKQLEQSCDRAGSIQWKPQFTGILKSLDEFVTSSNSRASMIELENQLRSLGASDD